MAATEPARRPWPTPAVRPLTARDSRADVTDVAVPNIVASSLEV
jgi:hypothetical protein